MILERTRYTPVGIFGKLLSDEENWLFFTLEHAFENPDGNYVPKVGIGTYQCVRGEHRLEKSPSPFQTFEVTNVPGHSGILFHVGNYNTDSDGCILLGEESDTAAVWASKRAFDSFMNILQGVDSFTLTVR